MDDAENEKKRNVIVVNDQEVLKKNINEKIVDSTKNGKQNVLTLADINSKFSKISRTSKIHSLTKSTK